ncbi:hypothetical protein FACS1894120_4530 [Clostridia bacterium]|nr:hypothetical protein FACS1894120_4530 [Clostridia bacterium]
MEEYDEDLYDWDNAPAPTIQVAPLPAYSPDNYAEEREKLLNLESEIKKQIIGQDEAIATICRSIRRGRAGFKDPARPVGSFIFLGPTGVGKTALCRVLAEALYGDKRKLIKIDMSEYMEKHEACKMTGTAPGYVGYDKGGQLINLVKQNPGAVLCIDEIEKAHPDVFNVFLQIMEDGVLTSGQGETVSFANIIIIMTSNLGMTEKPNAKIGFDAGDSAVDKAQADKRVRDIVRQTFKPEFLGRVDEVIVFNKLSEKDTRSICQVILKTVTFRAARLGIKLNFDKNAVAELVKLGYNKDYGVRPLRYVIAEKIENVLADRVLEGKLVPSDNIRVKFVGGEFTFEKKRTRSVTAKSMVISQDDDGEYPA